MNQKTTPSPTPSQAPAAKLTAKTFESVQSLLDRYQPTESRGYISREFQDFAYRLSCELDDLEHKSLYMRLAKTVPRAVLERALSFVKDAPGTKSRARLFMWKLKQLRHPPSPDQE